MALDERTDAFSFWTLRAILRRAVPRQITRLLDRAISTDRHLETLLGAAYLGAITNHPAPNANVFVAGGSTEDRDFAISIHAIRSRLRSDEAEGGQVIAVTSALPADGKTTSTLALARSAALAGLRTLLVDFDIRRASINSCLPTHPAYGLLEVLEAEVDLSSAILVENSTSLRILPLKMANATLANIFVSQEMDRLLIRLRLEFDLIFLDCAPVLVVADTRNAACLADSVILVARWRSTPVRAICAALRTLRDAGANVKGLVLTRKPTLIVKGQP